MASSFSVYHDEENVPDNAPSSSAVVTAATATKASRMYGLEARFPIKTLKDFRTPRAVKMSALTMFYGAMTSELFCRTRYNAGRFCHATCTCLYDAFLKDGIDGEPNSQLIRAVARYVIEEYYDKPREVRLCNFAQLIKNAELEYPEIDDPKKRPYELPVRTDPTSSTITTPRMICVHGLRSVFGVGPHLWGRCATAAAKADCIVSQHGSFEHHTHARNLDSNSRRLLMEYLQNLYDKAEIMPGGKLRRAATCQRESYLRYIGELGYYAEKTPTCHYLVKPREDWPTDVPRYFPVSKSSFLNRWKRHFRHLLPAPTKFAKVSLMKDGTYYQQCQKGWEDGEEEDDDDEDTSSSGSEVDMDDDDSVSSDSGSEEEIIIG